MERMGTSNVPPRRPRTVARSPRQLHQRLQRRAKVEDPERPHALPVHLQTMGNRTRSSDAGTEHLAPVKNVPACGGTAHIPTQAGSADNVSFRLASTASAIWSNGSSTSSGSSPHRDTLQKTCTQIPRGGRPHIRKSMVIVRLVHAVAPRPSPGSRGGICFAPRPTA